MDRPRVLLVEDDDQIREMLLMYLDASGFEVRATGSGKSAIRMLEQASPPPRVLVTDLQLPGASGRAVAEVARRLDPSTKVLFMSGDHEGMPEIQATQNPPAHVLQKPFLPSDLTRRIREMLGPAAGTDAQLLGSWRTDQGSLL